MLFPKPKAKSRKSLAKKKGEAFRTAVWARDGRRNGLNSYSGNCCRCGVHILQGENGTVDHIKPRSTHPERKYDPSNGRLACVECNDWLKRHPLERE